MLMIGTLRYMIFWFFVLIVLTGLCIFLFLRNPIFFSVSSQNSIQSDIQRLKQDVSFLTSLNPSRSYENIASLNKAADYIKAEFEKTDCNVSEQKFIHEGQTFRNIICSYGPSDAPRVILGAHYDVHGHNNPGADDNASAVAGVLELARLVSREKPDLKHRLDFIAYTLEETPHFRTPAMGSYVHAKSLKEENEQVKLMISVEMIGYFSDKPNSQHYPLSFLKWLYPSKGNFIGVVGLSFDRYLVYRAKKLMMHSKDIPVYSINAPSFIPGIDLSDHKNYWLLDYPALMVTDTAFFRNPNYHRSSDTADTLDYNRMSKVVDGLYHVAIKF